MKLNRYVNEVLDMAKDNSVEYEIAIRMFTGNVMQAAGQGDYIHPGLEGFDFAPLVPHLQELLDSSEGFVKDFEAHKAEVMACRKAGDYDGAVAIMEAAAEEREKLEAEEQAKEEAEASEEASSEGV